MKNRTIIGIVCMILAVAMTFAVAPLVNRLTSDTTTVVRLKQEVGRGAKITAEQVETVKVKTDTMPQGVYVNTADVIGKYQKATTEIKDRSLYDTGIEPHFKEQLLTLSTCFGDSKDSRIVVIGVEQIR